VVVYFWQTPLFQSAKKIKFFFSVQVMKVYRRNNGIAPLILNLGIRWRLVEELQTQATLSPGKKLSTDKLHINYQLDALIIIYS